MNGESVKNIDPISALNDIYHNGPGILMKIHRQFGLPEQNR